MTQRPLRDAILGFMRTQPQQAVTRSQLARRLEIPPTERSALRSALDQLLKDGSLENGPKGSYHLANRPKKNQLAGILKFLPKGNAFFYPDLGDPQNLATGIDLLALDRVQVARGDAGAALDGDRVSITLETARPARSGAGRTRRQPEAGPETRGRVVDVLKRRSGRVVGIFRQQRGFAWVECDDKAIDDRIEVVGDTTAAAGQLVVVDLTDWQQHHPRGRIIEVLGWPGQPGVDMEGIIHRFGLSTSFPEDVLAEARAVPEQVDAAEIKRRKDWRDKLVITIDPADAKDHDDAIWVERVSDGWNLGVHIADVSHYIKPGSPMDTEAVRRGNSTYLVDRVLPMLPVELSNGICSLKPDVDRLTKCALMHVSFQGRITRATFQDAIIHSRAKLSYEQAQVILDGGPAPQGSDPQLAAMVREAWKMASTLRRGRFESGSLDLDMPEVRIRLDEHGRACGAAPVIHTESHQLIEECMLAANEVVARVLRERQRPAIYRIHEDPDPSRLMDYAQTARQHGLKPGDLTHRAQIQKLLDSAKGRPEEHLIKLGLLKSLKRAAYAADPIGHYGLAKTDYCHFTSPIRRYADLIVHRALQPLLVNRTAKPDTTLPQARLADLARHISETERSSADAESESKMLKLFEYLQRLVDEHQGAEFQGLITEARPMGLMVEIPDMGLRGVIKREDLPQGRWRFEPHRGAWVSAKGQLAQIGMRLALLVVAIDHQRRFVDFTIAGEAPQGEALARPVITPATPPKKHHHGKGPPKEKVKPGHHKALQKRRGKNQRRKRR